MIGSTLAPKSCNTLANCGSTNVRKNKQYATRSTQHEQRIADGVAEPSFQRLGAASFVGQHFEHLVQRTGSLADPDQRDIHRRKQRLVTRQRFGETFAGDDMRPDIGDHRPQSAEIPVGGEQFEAVIDTRAGAQQQREIAGENRDVFRFGLVEQAEGAASRAAALLEGYVVDQHQTEPFDPLCDIAGCRRRDRA